MIRFEIPQPYALPNTYLGRDKFAASRARQKMRRIVWAASIGLIPPNPFQFAKVRIERWSVGEPDHDNLAGGAKSLIDCLTTPRVLTRRTPGAKLVIRNKNGLGFVVDDSPKHMVQEIVGVKCRRGEGKTVVIITPLDSIP